MKLKSFLYFYFIIYFSSGLPIPIFDIESINQDECEKTGKLILNGKILGTVTRNIKFNLPLEEPSGVTLSCKLIGDKSECETDRIINSKITIKNINITENDENVFSIKDFSPKKNINCANAFIKKITSKLSVNIVFRQVSHFKNNVQKSNFEFNLITLNSEALSKGDSLNLKMEIIINGMKEEKDAICILQDNVIPNNVKLAKGNFICSVKLTQDEYNNTDFDSIRISPENEEINGINDLDDVFYNPKKTDEAIQKIKEKKEKAEEITNLENVVDYLEEEEKVIPIFNIESINMEKCSSSGIFTLTGSFSEDITESMIFDFALTYPSNEVKCELPEAEKGENIEITCKLHSSFELVESILIEQKIIRKKYKEIFIIQKKEFKFPKNIKCTDYYIPQIEKVIKRKNFDFSFLQLNHFIHKPNFLSFLMTISRMRENKAFMSNYSFFAKLKIESQKIKGLYGIKINCNLNQTFPTSNFAKYDCTNNGSFIGTPISMKIMEADDINNIQGIPDNIIPEKLNNKIDYSSLYNLKDLDNVPDAYISNINGTTCIKDGQYTITATLNKNENLNSKYDNIVLGFAAPESSSLCSLTIENTNLEMVCYNKEKFYESKIYIERQLIKDENDKGLFFINSYESDEKIECDISLKTGSIVENDEAKSNYIVHKKSAVLSGVAIAGIVIGVGAAIIAIILLIYFLIKKGAKGQTMIKDATIMRNDSTNRLRTK